MTVRPGRRLMGWAEVAQDLARDGRLEDAGDDLAAGAALASQEVQVAPALSTAAS